MGLTSTEKSLDDLRAEYEALENKRSPEGAALRSAIKEAEGGESVGRGTDDLGVLPILDRLQSSERRAVYWCGVLPGNPETGDRVPPCHQIDNIGGVSFYEWHTPHEGRGQDGTPRRGQYPGYLVELTEGQVASLRAGLRTSVVRWRSRKGVHAHGTVVRIPGTDTIEELKNRFGLNAVEIARLKVRAEQFRLEESDEPVARYIYCVKVDGDEAKPGSTWRPSTTLPPSVEDMGRIDGP